LWLYKNLLELRKSNSALSIGDYFPLPSQNDIIAYVRKTEGQRMMIILNLSNKPCTYSTDKFEFKGKIALDSNLRKVGQKAEFPVELEGNEGIIFSFD
jgi:alpha-glucosidase